jgi:hypothetical protein
MYSLRLEYAKTHPMNLIAKLLMNSLYGKFGMRMERTLVEIFDISTDEGHKTMKKSVDSYQKSIKDFIKLDDKYIVVVRDSLVDLRYNEEQDMYHGTNVNIASTITSAARVFMSIFKNNPNFTLYYSDTDNIVTDQPLPNTIVGRGLGQFKLEHIITRAKEKKRK